MYYFVKKVYQVATTRYYLQLVRFNSNHKFRGYHTNSLLGHFFPIKKCVGEGGSRDIEIICISSLISDMYLYLQIEKGHRLCAKTQSYYLDAIYAPI